MLSGWVVYLGEFVCVCGVLVYNIIITPPEFAEIREERERFIQCSVNSPSNNQTQFLWRKTLMLIMERLWETLASFNQLAQGKCPKDWRSSHATI